MKKILSWIFLILTVLSAFIFGLAVVVILLTAFVYILHLPIPDMPESIPKYIWLCLILGAIVATASTKLTVVFGDTKKS